MALFTTGRLNLLLAGLTVLLAAGLGWQTVSDWMDRPAEPPAASRSRAAGQATPPPGSQAQVKAPAPVVRDLFKPREKAIEPTATPEPKPFKGLNLLGIVKNGKEAYAIAESNEKRGEPLWLYVGSMVGDKKVEEIADRYIVLSGPGGRRYVQTLGQDF